MSRVLRRLINEVTGEVRKHYDDFRRNPTEGQDAVRQATRGQRAARERMREGVGIGVGSAAILDAASSVYDYFSKKDETPDKEDVRKRFKKEGIPLPPKNPRKSKAPVPKEDPRKSKAPVPKKDPRNSKAPVPPSFDDKSIAIANNYKRSLRKKEVFDLRKSGLFK